MADLLTLDTIPELYQRQLNATNMLRDRMDADWRRYRLDEYQAGDDVESYTSNEPRAFADKMIGILANAKLRFKVPYADGWSHRRDAGDLKEKLAIGLFNHANERLSRRGQGGVHGQVSNLLPIRGFACGRFLLHNDGQGRAVCDITPWDIRHVCWEEAEDGLAWIIRRTWRTAAQIEAEWGVDLEMPETSRLAVYDAYDGRFNAVMADGRWLKRPEEHLAPRCPAVVALANEMPFIEDGDGEGGGDPSFDMQFYGESVYAANRVLFDKHNMIMSIRLELAKRARDGSYIIKSRDGKRRLSENPAQASQEIALSSDDEFEWLPLLEMSRDADAFLAMVDGEVQRGGLPHTVYGDIQVALSGYAINTLRQGVSTVLQPYVRCQESFYLQGMNLLIDQYASGYYDAMQLSGMARNRSYFDERILPEQIQFAGGLTVKVLPDLPQDDPAKLQMALQATAGPNPLVDMRFAREEIMEYQDADMIGDAVMAQQAMLMSPMAMKQAQMAAAYERGEKLLGDILMGEIMIMMMQSGMPPPQGGGERPALEGQGSTPGAGGNPQPGGMPANVLPPQQMGIQAAPIQQPGALVPRGTPRPRAQSDTTRRLNNIGLMGPNQGG